MKLKIDSAMLSSLMLAVAVLTGCATRTGYAGLYGQPSPVSGADRMIVIHPDTRHVNVEGGETVAFQVGDRQFAWNFFVASHITSFLLNDVAPPGMLDHPVQAYVSLDPRYGRW